MPKTCQDSKSKEITNIVNTLWRLNRVENFLNPGKT